MFSFIAHSPSPSTCTLANKHTHIHTHTHTHTHVREHTHTRVSFSPTQVWYDFQIQQLFDFVHHTSTSIPCRCAGPMYGQLYQRIPGSFHHSRIMCSSLCNRNINKARISFIVHQNIHLLRF
jgi:hypothetical protein